MRLLLLFLTTTPLLATDKINFVNLLTEVQADKVIVKAQAEPFLSYEILKDENYDLAQGGYEMVFDAPMRQAAFLMRTLDRNRGSIMSGDKNLLAVRFRFELAMRQITGDVIYEKEYDVDVGISPEKGTGVLYLPDEDREIKVPLNTIRGESYADYLANFVFPYEQLELPKPNTDEFLIDLYFKWPKVLVKEKDFSVFDLFPSAILWNRNPILNKVKLHLGTTYAYQKDNTWEMVYTEHPRFHKRALSHYGELLAQVGEADVEEIIADLEEYVDAVPGERPAMKRLMDLYMDDERYDEAYGLITRFQPFFATIRDGLPNKNRLEEKAERKRNWLLGRKAAFTKDENVTLKITQPANGDLVTGTTDLAFSLAGHNAKILEIEAYLDDQRITTIYDPPFKTRFTTDGATGFLDLRVVAYFEDQTFQEDVIRIRTFKVDEEEQVNLVSLRTSVFNPGRELKKEDFRVKENGQVMEVQNFRKDSAPLRVAIILDTSISMFGKKLYRAQYAVKSFISKLEPDDSVSIYSFGTKVLKLNDFTNDFDSVTPKLMTLSPHQWGTALFDAILIANDALEGQNGTKVLIIISDGDDSSSATSDIQVVNTMVRSPTMVYSVSLPGGVLNDGGRGEFFLRELSRMTGSISTRVRTLNGLNETFERVYQDLKSFYYLDYYSSAPPEERDLDVRLTGASGKLRVRTVN